MINNLTIVGTIAFDPTSNPAQTAATIHVNCRRNFKKESDQYYPTDKIVCKALSEQRAKMIMERFSKGDIVIVQGRLQKSDDYINKEQQEVKGDWELIIDHIDGPFIYKKTDKDATPATPTANGTIVPPAPKTGATPPPPAPKGGPKTPPPVPPKSSRPVPPVPPRA